jgi:Na+-driven multidrug efflux pump
MLGVGTTTLISQAAGRKDQLQGEVAFNQSFVMSLIVAAALGVFSFLLRDFYCDSLGADPYRFQRTNPRASWKQGGVIAG